MMRIGGEVGEKSSKRVKGTKMSCENTKRTRYTNEQIEVLEKIYATCPNPNCFPSLQIKHDEPLLKDIDNKNLKIWFQNRRSRERQKKGSEELVAEMTKLATLTKLLREENDSINKKLAQLQCENECLRNQVIILTSTLNTTTDHVFQADHRLASGTIDNNTGILSLAEDIKTDFLAKATKNAMDWIPIPMSKLSSSIPICTIYISNACMGVAARACATIHFEPSKTVELLKDRLSWSRECRNLEVHAKYDVANNGGSVELIYTRNHAATTLACARDFWTLRYTSILDDGSFVVCEKSISGSNGIPSSPATLEFVRGKMMASGYLVRACEGGSIVHVVDHIDFEASSVPEIIRSLYESPELVATKMTISAIQYVEKVATEANYKINSFCLGPTVLRSFGRRISRSFNDAVNGFTEDGWTLLRPDGCDDIITTVKPNVNEPNSIYDCIMCVKTSLLLGNISPAKIVSFLKERRSEWMGFDFCDHSEALSRVGCFVYPQQNIHNLSNSAVFLGETGYGDEVAEIIKFDYLNNNLMCDSPKDLFHVQISNGLQDTDFGACSEFIFAPIERTLPNDCVLLSSGFRIFSLCSNTVANSTSKQADVSHQERTLVIMAFQFPFESHRQVNMVAMVRKYIQHIISTITNSFLEATSTHVVNHIAPDMSYENNLAALIFQSYRSSLGVDMLGVSFENSDSLYDQMEHHQYAILYFSLIAPGGCIYANKMALNMLETTTENLQSLTIDKILGGANMSLQLLSPNLMQQGYAILPPGYCISMMNRGIAHEQGVAWLLHEPDGSAQSIALAICDWSFV